MSKRDREKQTPNGGKVFVCPVCGATTIIPRLCPECERARARAERYRREQRRLEVFGPESVAW